MFSFFFCRLPEMSKSCFTLESHDALWAFPMPSTEHSPVFGSVEFNQDFRKDSTSTKAQGLTIRQIEEVEIRGTDLLVQSTTWFRGCTHWPLEPPTFRDCTNTFDHRARCSESRNSYSQRDASAA